MNRWKQDLKLGFSPPPPAGKRAFLRQLPLPQMPLHRFLLGQMSYIRKRVWCLSALVLCFAAGVLAGMQEKALWILPGMTPLLALLLLAEGGRSQTYGMAELEAATRFSLRSVLLARLLILGLGDGVILTAFFAMGLAGGSAGALMTGLYILIPFLLTCYTGLLICRRLRGREAAYGCTVAAAAVSLGVFLTERSAPWLLRQEHEILWLILALLLLWGCARQGMAIYREKEAFAWS